MSKKNLNDLVIKHHNFISETTLVNNKEVEKVIERLKKSRFTDKIVVAIPNNKKNYHLKKHLKQINAEIFLGNEDNVLKRIYGAAKKFKSKNIVRITADCPLIDPKLVDDMLTKFSKNKFDYIN